MRGAEDSSCERESLWIVLWNVGLSRQFFGLWGGDDSSLDCGAVGTVSWIVERWGQFYGM